VIHINIKNYSPKNTIKNIYLETFLNEYGERFWFNYNSEEDMGILWSNDNLIKNNTYYIFDNKFKKICDYNTAIPHLVLSDKELNWLKKTWNKYTKHYNIYNNLNTKLFSNENCNYLSNNYCPICLEQKNNFEKHHCIPSFEGGSDDKVNILVICNSCHALITRGCNEEAQSRILACVYHQIAIYGINFYMMNPMNNRRLNNQDKKEKLYEIRPYIKKIIDIYKQLNKQEKNKTNELYKEIALYKYKLNRNITRGII